LIGGVGILRIRSLIDGWYSKERSLNEFIAKDEPQVEGLDSATPDAVL
jgi:hypothetical protein